MSSRRPAPGDPATAALSIEPRETAAAPTDRDAAAYDSELLPLATLLRQAAQEQASDIHLRVGSPPRIRIDGELYQVKGYVPTDGQIRRWIQSIVGQEAYRQFERVLELDFSHVQTGVARMRVNLYVERGLLCAAIRLVAEAIPSMEDLGLPRSVADLTRLDHGLVLVTGPTGSGKSTTLAAMIAHINATRRCHILTIEDPIEFHHEEKRALVSQREVDRDTRSFTGALRHAFRQDPDVVLIGEMRDPETMQIALTLAETGHLTFSTLHTSDAPQTITRVVDAMPPHLRDQIRIQVAGSLMAVISQRLLPLKGRKGRIAAREIMVCNRAIRNLIREGKIHQLNTAIQTGMEEGMVTMNAALAHLVSKGFVDLEVAKIYSEDVKDLMIKVTGQA